MDFSSCKGKRFETLPSVFVASLPGLVLASPGATSSMVHYFDSPEPALFVGLTSSQYRDSLSKRIELLVDV